MGQSSTTPPALGDIPVGLTTGRISTSGIVAYCSSEFQEQGGPAEATSTLVLQVLHGSQDSGSFVIRVYKGLLGGTATWYNAAGVGTTLNTIVAETPPTIYYNSVTPTAVRFEVSTNGGGFVDRGWVNISNVGNSLTEQLTSFAEANSGQGRITATDTKVIRCYGRANGYNDTLLATFSMTTFAAAESDF